MSRYSRAVENIIQNCLRVAVSDRVVVITDRERLEIGRAIHAGAAAIAEAKLMVIEDYTARPAKELPAKMIAEINEFSPTVSVYAATGKEGELPVFRSPLREHLTNRLKARHAHMISIDEKLMLDGMSQDYARVQKVVASLYKILSKAKKITVSDPYGTKLKVVLSPKRRWKACDGLIVEPGFWTNLPDGECFTCPIEVNGTVAAWVIGEYFSDRYGLLPEPVKITIKNSRVVKVAGKNKKLVSELTDYLSLEPNGNRVGEFAIGALVGLKKLTGNLLQDEKFPGVHMAFGGSYPEDTGADWDAETHVDVIPLKVDVDVDGERLLRKGKFVVDLG